MIRRVRDFFVIPEFQDADQNLAARLLSAILVTIVGLTFFLTYPLALMLPSGGVAIATQGTFALTFAAILFLLLRQQKVAVASWSLVSLFWLLNLSAVWTGGGITSPSYANFMLVILTAGLLIGARAGVVFTVLSVLFGLGAVIAQNNGYLNDSIVQQTPFTRWFGSAAIFFMVALLQGFASRMTRQALQRARQSEALAKQELAERKQAELRYRALVEQIPAITYLDEATKEGNSVYISPQVEEILGVTAHEWVNGKIEFWLSLIHPEDRLQAHELYLESAKTGKPFDMEYRIHARDGRELWMHDRAVVLLNPDGNPQWVHGVIFDITNQKQAQLEREKLIGELETKNSEMERFVYTVSHDLKSPIVTIVGFLGFVEDDVQSGNMEAFAKDMDRIHQAALKMQKLLQDLLELSRIGRVMNDPEVVSTDRLVNEAIELTQGRLQEHGVGIRIQPNMPDVFGDRQRLLELVQNLIDNAAKYMGDQPEPLIEIGVSDVTDLKSTFFVKDNGIGVAPEYHEKIFGLFNKLDPKVDGTGVGLAIVKRIVEFHGGKIWIDSAPGFGTTFHFTLPTQPSGQTQNKPAASSQA